MCVCTAEEWRVEKARVGCYRALGFYVRQPGHTLWHQLISSARQSAPRQVPPSKHHFVKHPPSSDVYMILVPPLPPSCASLSFLCHPDPLPHFHVHSHLSVLLVRLNERIERIYAVSLDLVHAHRAEVVAEAVEATNGCLRCQGRQSEGRGCRPTAQYALQHAVRPKVHDTAFLCIR